MSAAITHSIKILDGEDAKHYQTLGDLLSGVPAYVKVDDGARSFEAAMQRKQSGGLKTKGIE